MQCLQDAPRDAPCMDPDTPPESCCGPDAACCGGKCIEPTLFESGIFDDPSMVCGDSSCCEDVDSEAPLSAEGPMAGFPEEAPFEFDLESGGDKDPKDCCGADMFCCGGVCRDVADQAFTTCPVDGPTCCGNADEDEPKPAVDTDVEIKGAT